MSLFNMLSVIKDCNSDVDACSIALDRVTQLLVAQGLVQYMPCAATTAVAKPLPPLLSLVHGLARRTRDLVPAVSPCVCCDSGAEDIVVPSTPSIFGPDMLNAVTALEYVIAMYVRTVLQPIGLLAAPQSHYINSVVRGILDTPAQEHKSFADSAMDYHGKFGELSKLLCDVCDYVTGLIATDCDVDCDSKYLTKLTAVLETDGVYDEADVPKNAKKVKK